MNQRISLLLSLPRSLKTGTGTCDRVRRSPVIEALERRALLSALFTPAPAQNAQLGYSPSVAAVGDFNGDGIPDLALVDLQDHTLRVLVGDGHGGFTASPGPPVSVGYVSSVVAGDFNGDGKLDLAYVNTSDNIVSVFLGNGEGGFAPAPGSPITAGNRPVHIAAGDFAGNGKLDLAVVNQFSSNVTVLLGNGNGTFTPAPGSPVALRGEPVALAVGDLNGNGKLDIAVALDDRVTMGDEVELLSGNGHGRFTAAGPVIPIAGTSITSIAAGDFTGDGRIDLATLDEGNSDLSVLLNGGRGRFAMAPGSPISVENGLGPILVADFTGNGRQDLAIANYTDISILLAQNDGTFVNAPGSPFVGGFTAEGALNGSGEPDLLVGKADGTLSALLDTSPAGLPTGTLGAAVAAKLPAVAHQGARLNGRATVTVSAPASQPVQGPVSIALYASPAVSLFGAKQLTPVTRTLTIKAGGSVALRIPFTSFPTAGPGTYHLIAAVTAPDGTVTAVAGPSVTIPARVVSVHASNVTASPTTVAPGGRASLALTLRNGGNAPTSGSASLTVSLSASDSEANGQIIASMPLRVKLKASQTKIYRVRFAVPKGFAMGSYYLVTSLGVSSPGDTMSADGLAVSATPITVS